MPLPLSGSSPRVLPNARVLTIALGFGLLIVGQVALLRAVGTCTSCASDGIRGGVSASVEAYTSRLGRWDYWPYGIGGDVGERVRVGIVTGGSSDLYGGGPESYADATTCLLRLFSQRHGYAFYAERAMQRLGSDRPVAWQKVRLLTDRLPDVDLLLWIDADVAWTAGDTDLVDLFFRRLTTQEACRSHMGQQRWADDVGAAALAAEPSSGDLYAGEIFFWVSADVRAKQQRNMNINSAVIALRSGEDAQRFLAEIWAEGLDPLSFVQHNPTWKKTPVGSHYWGWPFEQGAVWSVLERDRELLRRTCVTAVGELHSVKYNLWHPGGAPGAHMPGMPSTERRKAACRHLSEALAVNPQSCGDALRSCPDLFAGRVIAAHADGLCEHCLGHVASSSPYASGSTAAWAAGNVSDWSAFDCSCLR